MYFGLIENIVNLADPASEIMLISFFKDPIQTTISITFFGMWIFVGNFIKDKHQRNDLGWLISCYLVSYVLAAIGTDTSLFLAGKLETADNWNDVIRSNKLAVGFSIAGFISIFIWIISFCKITYILWACIPENIRRCTPSQAVGFCFVPFFNFYWWFVAFIGLALDINKAAKEQGKSKLANIEFTVFCCISWILCPIVSIILEFVFIAMESDNTVATSELEAIRAVVGYISTGFLISITVGLFFHLSAAVKKLS
jgi:hypothetical protein